MIGKILWIEMLSDERPMKKENKQIDAEEVWSAIRYLDPDRRNPDREVRSATMIAAFALLLTVCAVWVVLWLTFRGV